MNMSSAVCELRLSPRLAGIPMTPEQFDAVTECDERYRYELIKGVLVVTPPPLEGERDPNGELNFLLRTYKYTHPKGRVLDATLTEQTVPTRRNRRRADRVIWVGLGRTPDPAVDVPSIVAEFVSRSRRDWLRDYVTKRREYLRIGVLEYWVIDRFRRIMTVIRNTPDGPVEIVIRENQTYRTPLLPGFRLPLARLLEVADTWRKTEE